MLFTALSALSLASAAAAQSVQIVKVGATANDQGGVFQFIPPTVTATNGSIVSFQFTGAPGNHTVTQSSFADPCNPLSGGFDSGWVFVPPGVMGVPEFNVTITNDSKPIWFYCKQLSPQPHCSSGMVGSINAPTSGNTFQAFQTAARAFKGNSGQGVGNLVGVGASASAVVGPLPSGVNTFGSPNTGAATAASSAASASASGSAPAPASATGSAPAPASATDSAASATATSPASGSASASTPSSTSGAASHVASSVVALLAAALGFVMV